ncbi:glutathione S-transferase family protein [Caenimonas terrae]|uniref:Glutathione S-transferase family protein n=1 Tax=Caenimonas terrae TaxID=696074 RepID=A0ABW0NE93_9BURK
MLSIWGRISSINVRKVVYAAQELGLAFQRIDAGSEFGIVRTPDYLARNPNALVPLLEDGEVQLWESNVIVRYLCARHSPGALYPLDLAQRFDAERWMDWQQTTLNPAGRPAFVQWFRTPADKRNMAAIAESTAATEGLLALLDAHLARQPFMAGERMTMADIPIACEVHRWHALPQARPAHPNLDRWYNTLRSRPAARGVFDFPLT